MGLRALRRLETEKPNLFYAARRVPRLAWSKNLLLILIFSKYDFGNISNVILLY